MSQDFREVFKDLPDGACWITGKRLKQFAAMLQADRARLATTSGTEIPTSQGRFIVPNETGANAVTDTFSKPWQVQVKNFGTKLSPIWRFIVYRGSRLLGSSAYDDEETVDGKAEDYIPSDSDPGWNAFGLVGGGCRVWIECELDTTDSTWGDVLTADIRWDGGGTWGGGEYQYSDTGTGGTHNYVNNKVRKLIAIIYDRDGTGDYQVDQWVDTHLQLQYTGGEANDSSGGSPQSTALRGIFPMG